MIWGFLLGIILTTAVIVISTKVFKKSLTPLSYVVAIVLLVLFCIEGVRMGGAVEAHRHSMEIVELVQDAVETYLPSSAKSHRISREEAVAVKTGMALFKTSKFVKIDDLTGYTVGELGDALQKSVRSNTAHHIWMTVLAMAITFALGLLLLSLTGGRPKTTGHARRSGGEGYSTRGAYEDF